jgi:protein TonB
MLRKLQPIQILDRPKLMTDLCSTHHASRRLWGLAAFGALAIHAAAAGLAAVQVQSESSDVPFGAPAIEIGLEMTSPSLDPTDLPPGPDTPASIASPAIVEQTSAVAETELPRAQPIETPVREAAPDDPKQPKQDDSRIAAVQASASSEAIAADATAMPSHDAVQSALRSVAPAPGIAENARRARATWQKVLLSHLDKHKRYPAARAVRSAEIIVNFVIDRIGHVVSIRMVRGSGDAAFDEAALAMVRHSDPVPQPPPLVADQGLSFTLPVIFQVGGPS